MTQPHAELDARARPGEIPATALVGGIPLVVRPLRQLARRGWTAARVLAGDEDRARALRAALARHPVPAALAVEVTHAHAHAPARDAPARAARGQTGGPAWPAADPPPALALDARAIYRTADLPRPEGASAGAGAAPEPAPLVRVRGPADVVAAERALFEQIRKSVDLDGVVSYYVIRPLARVLTRALLPTRVAPNHVTACALVCALVAALLAAGGGATAAAVAGVLYWLGGALDHVDGELARLRLQSSRVGEWLDAMTDEVSTFSLLTGLGIGLWRDGAGAAWLWIGLCGSAVGALAVARLYVDLHRLGLPIDTAQFPWFFSRPGRPARSRGAAGTLLHWVTFLVRRDANVTGVALLLLVGWRELATALVAAGAVVAALVTAAHYAVTATRTARTAR